MSEHLAVSDTDTHSPMAADILDRIARVLSPTDGPHPLHAPEIDGNAWAYVKDCLDTGWVSSVGKWVDRFETMIMDATGAQHAIATVNGTAALHAALFAAGVRPGDEVLIPSFTFVATANAIHYCSATPHFVECESRSLGIDPAALEPYLDKLLIHRDGQFFNRHTNAPVRAIVPVHCYGHPVDMDALRVIAARYELILIEDAAESLGSAIRDRHTGRFGRAGVFSFNGNKTITTGGGGAIVTDDALLARRIRHLTTTARAGDGTELIHDAVGFNYRMPNLNAALGCAQLETLATKLETKCKLAARYAEALSGLDGVTMVMPPDWGHSNHWLNTILFDTMQARDDAFAALNANGYQCRAVWTPLHHMPMYADNPRMDLPVTEDLAARGLLLPSGSGLVQTGTTSSTDR